MACGRHAPRSDRSAVLRLRTSFVALAGLSFFGVALGFFGGSRRASRLRPSRRRAFRPASSISVGLGVGAVVRFGVDQGQRHFGHAGGLAVARAGEDDVFHA